MEDAELGNYLETHFEVVSTIMFKLSNDNKFLTELYQNNGRGAMWELAKSLTDEFEQLHKDEDWIELEWFDTLDEFLNYRLS